MTELHHFVPQVCKRSFNCHQNNNNWVSADVSKSAELMANKSDPSSGPFFYWSEVLWIDAK